MGRRRKRATKDGDVIDEKYTDGRPTAVDERLGYTDTVCTDCNARNPENATECRKCGCTQLREKADNYRDA